MRYHSNLPKTNVREKVVEHSHLNYPNLMLIPVEDFLGFKKVLERLSRRALVVMSDGSMKLSSIIGLGSQRLSRKAGSSNTLRYVSSSHCQKGQENCIEWKLFAVFNEYRILFEGHF
jgi:hypothetical protein